MKQLTGALLLLCICLPLTAGDADQKRRVKAAAQEMLDAFSKGEYETFLNYLPPRALAQAGGREKLLAKMKSFAERTKAAGVKIESVTVAEPTALARKDRAHFAFVPTTQVMTARGKQVTVRDHLIGSSEDGGKTWKFINRAKMSRDEIRALLPAFPDDLKLPPPEETTVEQAK